MAHRLIAALVVAIAGALAGCGHLRVKVDILDPQYVRGEIADEALRKTYRQIVVARPGDLAAQVDANFKAYQREVNELARRYVELARKYPSKPAQEALVDMADGLRQSVGSGSIVEDAARHGTVIEEKAQAIRVAGAASAWPGRGPVPQGLRDQLAGFDVESRKLAVIQQRDVRELAADVRKIVARLPAPTPAQASAIAAAAKDVAAQEAVTQAVAQRSIIQGAELTHTEYAYVVASAKPELWSPRFNEAYGSGTFGNVDVVIRMNSAADFSVKGMRFDASTVAQVASKVLTQSLLVAAQVAGVPVASASSGTTSGGDALSKSSADLAAIEQVLTNRQAQTDAQRSAVRVAARSLLGAAPQLESGALKDKPPSDATRTALHESVLATFNALKPQLELQDLR